MVLVTGPTGSGKTTTLYAALAEINAAELKVITVEDPVEYRLPAITQVQVNDKIELTFARVLRACLRQDPDVILVGEMRDAETAEIGLRAAITGHLVLSTLHTRDAISTPFRLLDMGVPPFMVATSPCRPSLPSAWCGSIAPNAPHHTRRRRKSSRGWTRCRSLAQGLPPKRGLGCSACNGTGYAGRQGVYELLEMDAVLTQAASRSDPASFMRTARERMKGHTMAHHALELVRQGRTSLAEALRIGFDADDDDLLESLSMAVYAWRGRNNRGEAVNGQLEAMTESGVADQLLSIGVSPVHIALAAAQGREVHRYLRWPGSTANRGGGGPADLFAPDVHLEQGGRAHTAGLCRAGGLGHQTRHGRHAQGHPRQPGPGA